MTALGKARSLFRCIGVRLVDPTMARSSPNSCSQSRRMLASRMTRPKRSLSDLMSRTKSAGDPPPPRRQALTAWKPPLVAWQKPFSKREAQSALAYAGSPCDATTLSVIGFLLGLTFIQVIDKNLNKRDFLINPKEYLMSQTSIDWRTCAHVSYAASFPSAIQRAAPCSCSPYPSARCSSRACAVIDRL